MPRYEFKEGSSSKFWEITLSGSAFTTRWGRIGTEGQEKTQHFDSSAEARKEHDKLIREKEKKGYELAGDAGAEAGDGEATPSATNPALEAAILADPDNVEAYLAYGTWLSEQGDPRGELIALQHALSQASGTEASNLKRKITVHLKTHQEHFLGELAEAVEDEELSVEWYLGFIRSARVAKKDYDSTRDIPDTALELLTHPSAKFLRGLTIGMAEFDGENVYDSVIEKLAEAGGSKTIQDLFIGDFQYPDEMEISWSHLNDVSPLLQVLPALRTLRLRGASLELGKLHLPELREFTVETGGLPLSAVKSIVTAKWPKLERLEIWFGSENYGAEGGVKDIRPLLEGKGVPNLKRLGLRNSEFTDALCEVLPTAKVLPQLETLDLSMGTMSDKGAGVLAEHAAAFSHLRELDVTENTLTPAGQKLVAKLAGTVSAGNQREYDEEYRYAAVGE
ncbi:WGR domain-containing protein [Stigmatella hybrida]|uniref:WGR domain-containing protein n=1 Tax=Stigmatella hybrida TaxID=394097 RepID=UPI001CDAF516|nr:WGR domain-containing protein [Stigmatella hybrida]